MTQFRYLLRNKGLNFVLDALELKPVYRRVFEDHVLRFPPKSLEKIGEEIGCSKERCRQIVAKTSRQILRKMEEKTP